MCGQIMGEQIVTARKEHHCTAFEIINSSLTFGEILEGLESEFEVVVFWRMIKNGFKIKIGEKYRRYGYADEGTVFSCKESMLGAKICSKLDLYEC